jgi:hypothetical protein
LHKGELHNLYSSPDITEAIKSSKMRLAGHVACIGEMRNGYKILIRKADGRPKCKWEDNIKIGVELGYEGAEWIRLAQDRVHFSLVLVFTYCR